MSYTLRNLLIAAGLALIGIILVTSYVKSQRASLERGKQYVMVLTAAKDIPAGTRAKVLEEEGYVERTKLLREDTAPMVLHDLKDVSKLSVSVTVYKGEQLTAHKFETTSGLNPTEQIKGTDRFVSLPIYPTGTVAGLVRVGDHVDIFASAMTRGQVGTFVVARDVVVAQTPQSLMPEGTEVVPEPLKANDDPELYVFQVSDKVVQNLLYSNALGDDTKLVMALRPSDGDQESALNAETGIPNVN